MSFDVHQLDHFLLAGALVTLLAILAVRFTSRAGLPTLLIYLLIGVLMGESGLGLAFEDPQVAQALGIAALVVILAEGGLTTVWSDVRGSVRMGAVLATFGIVVSVAVMAVTGHYLLGLDWQVAFLLGAVCSSTDSAAVFSVLRSVPLPRRLVGALESESGLNDAPTVVMVSVVASGAFGDYGFWLSAGLVLVQLLGGVLTGLLMGFGGAWVMRRAALPASGLYPLAVLCLCVLTYGTGAAIQVSGIAGVYVCALVLGNQELPHRAATRSFAEGFAWLAQIGLFVMLGLLASPTRLDLHTVALAMAAGTLLTFVARPLSVFACAPADRSMSVRDLSFLSWGGLRGAVPIVLTTIPMAEGVDGAFLLFDLVFLMVVVFTLFTGPTLPLAARVCGVAVPSAPRGLDVEAAPLERIAADLLQITIEPTSQMHGVEVGELRLPHGASVSLVIRGGQSMVPERRTVLRHGDDLLVVTPRRHREATEERLRQVSAKGRLAQWLEE